MKRIVMLLLMMFFISSITFPVRAEVSSPYLLIDGLNGQILLSSVDEEPIAVGEVSQLMTIYVLEQAKKEGKWKGTDEVILSNKVANVARELTQSEEVPKHWQVGVTYQASELYALLLVEQSPLAALALAEYVYGNDQDFLHRMEEEAKRLDLGYTRFANVMGVSNEALGKYHPQRRGPQDESMMTVKGVGKLAYQLLQEFPHITEETKRAKGTIERNMPIPFQNPQLLIEEGNTSFATEGVNGLRVGHSKWSGYTNVATMKRGRYQWIAVSAASKNREETDTFLRQLFLEETKKLREMELLSPKEPLPFPWTHEKIGEKEIPLYVDQSIYAPVFEDDTFYRLKWKPKSAVNPPLKKGTVVGTLELIQKNGESLEYIDATHPIEVDVVVREDVKHASFIEQMSLTLQTFWQRLLFQAKQLFALT